MKRKKIITTLSVAIAIVVSMNSCKKEIVTNSSELSLKEEINQVPPGGVGEHTKWSWQEEMCVATTDNVCCHNPNGTMT